jgi:hypothetical protein
VGSRECVADWVPKSRELSSDGDVPTVGTSRLSKRAAADVDSTGESRELLAIGNGEAAPDPRMTAEAED